MSAKLKTKTIKMSSLLRMKAGVGAIVSACMVVMLFGQSTARFDECYAACYFECIIDMGKTFPYVRKKFLPCAWKCLKHCLFHDFSLTQTQYCKLGCSLDSCADSCDGNLVHLSLSIYI